MTTLDTRARKAAAAIHHSVAEFTPTVTAADLARRGAWHRGLNFAGALAVIVLAVVVGSLLRSAIERDEVADTLPPEPVVTTTIAAVDEPIVETGLPDIVVPTDPDAEPADPVVPVREDGGDARTPVTVPPPVDEPPVVDEVDTEPPLIEITSPEDGATFEEKIVRFAGRTEPGATVAAGKYDADVTEDGVWGITLVLSPGGNRATFIATDAAGNTATASITVYYEPPPPPEPPKEFEFTAFATYGSCELDPPYDVYYGTAKPGERVTVSSEFGGGAVEADAEGHWEIKVFFPEAPFGKTILVKVKDSSGHSKSFEFTSLAGEGA